MWWGLQPKSFLCLLMLFLVLNFLPQPLQTITRPLCCQIVCWLGAHTDLKAMSHTIQGWTICLICALSTCTDLIQQQHEYPHKPALEVFRSRCQQMRAPLHVIPKADSRLEGDVADDKADPSTSNSEHLVRNGVHKQLFFLWKYQFALNNHKICS